MTSGNSIEVRFYTRAGCRLCEAAYTLVRSLTDRYPIELSVLDVDGDPDLASRYGQDVPVVEVRSPRGEKTFRHRLEPDAFETEIRRLWNT